MCEIPRIRQFLYGPASCRQRVNRLPTLTLHAKREIARRSSRTPFVIPSHTSGHPVGGSRITLGLRIPVASNFPVEKNAVRLVDEYSQFAKQRFPLLRFLRS